MSKGRGLPLVRVMSRSRGRAPVSWQAKTEAFARLGFRQVLPPCKDRSGSRSPILDDLELSKSHSRFQYLYRRAFILEKLADTLNR